MEEPQRLLLGDHAVQRGEHGQQLAGSTEHDVTVVDGLIDPFLQCRVELVGLRCEDQHVTWSQPDLPGTSGDGHRHLERATGGAEQQAALGQCPDVRAAGHQYDIDAGTCERAADGAADRAGTDHDVAPGLRQRHDRTPPSSVNAA